MKFDFEKVAEQVLRGEIKGYFILRNNERFPSIELYRNACPITGYDYPYIFNNGKTYTPCGMYQYGDKTTPFDIIEFIAFDNN